MRFFAALLLIALLVLSGCNSAAPVPCVSAKVTIDVARITREKEDTSFELKLREDELDKMMSSVKGAVGVTDDWLQRKAELTEKITQLKVKEHDLDQQLSSVNDPLSIP